MNTQNFTTTLSVNETPEAVFDAINDRNPLYTPGPRTSIRVLRELLERVGDADQRQFAQADRHG